jgi:hypothetical protein
MSKRRRSGTRTRRGLRNEVPECAEGGKAAPERGESAGRARLQREAVEFVTAGRFDRRKVRKAGNEKGEMHDDAPGVWRDANRGKASRPGRPRALRATASVYSLALFRIEWGKDRVLKG